MEPPVADPDYQALLELCKSSNDYPITASAWSKYYSRLQLQAHSKWLRENETSTFQKSDPGCISFWETAPTTSDSDWEWTETEIKSMTDLSEHRYQLKPDPKFRHMFINARRSVSHVNCSLEMIKFLFTFHQVDPSFLGFAYNFHNGFTDKRADSSLPSLEPAVGNTPWSISSLNRSGNVICHSFLLRGIESGLDPEAPRITDSWSRRQGVSYHSFDMNAGTAVWITLKSNDHMHAHIRNASSDSLVGLAISEDLGARFEASLATRLIYFDWCLLHWRWLATELETRFNDTVWVMKLLTSEPRKRDRATRHQSLDSRAIVEISSRKTQFSLVVSKVDMNGEHYDDVAARFYWGGVSNRDVLGVIHHGLTPLLERLQRLDLDLDLNIGALNSVCEVYESLKAGGDLSEEFGRAVKGSVDQFLFKVRIINKSLQGQRKHLLSLQIRIKETRTLYEGIARLEAAKSNRVRGLPGLGQENEEDGSESETEDSELDDDKKSGGVKLHLNKTQFLDYIG